MGDREMLQARMRELVSEDICLAFSGGVDSSLLLKVAADAAAETGKKVYAVTFDSRLHPSCDLRIARQVAGELGGIHQVMEVDELEQEEIRMNPVNRCYLCKRHLFMTLKKLAGEKGVRRILDGTNEDDMHVYRPGIRALKELGIISPLAELHITKEAVKGMASEYGISVASRPSTPCMATRLPYNTRIDYDVLDRIAQGEAYLRDVLPGNVRLRLHGGIARLEVDNEAFARLLDRRADVVRQLKGLGFTYVALDLEGFRSGSMDVGITEVHGSADPSGAVPL
ncbi:ATP-dependent sacrificial sulfur transferase LarE [Enterocloster aldenensis]|uniref:ATP-dependent sacrificial sulfur transferase LarE n=1 Tax=Enterocloster aldenensis TaxID=358742 RepID=UPI000E4230FA|nr:ATP-dependent sacrificial sulfur transferase LarE [Enterocloster aldenensis]